MPDMTVNANTPATSPVQSKTPDYLNGVKVVDGRKNGMDKDSFLKLLVTELSHQDPLKPMNDREFVSQMAQFSALEQMKNVASSVNSMKAFQANSLVGKTITGEDNVHKRTVTGVVRKVTYSSNGDVFLNTQMHSIKLDKVQSVEMTAPANSADQENNVSRETLPADIIVKENKDESDESNRENQRRTQQ